MSNFPSALKSGCVALAIGVCLAIAPDHAQAFWRGGVWIGVPPVVIGPPAYVYPPPYYYPPAYYPPPYPPPPPTYTPAPQAPQAQQGQAEAEPSRPYGTTCYAGIYTCAAPPSTQVESGCSCPGIGAPSYGVVQ